MSVHPGGQGSPTTTAVDGLPPTFAQLDRAIGAIVGAAYGDALGAGYEFAHDIEEPIEYRRGRLTGEPPGHWTDDTAMTYAMLEVAASHGRLDTDEAAHAVGARFLDWWRSAPSDIGVHTAEVLALASTDGDVAAAASEIARRSPQSAGNGSLMRTAPVALAHFGQPADVARAARSMSRLTHQHPDAVDACVLWSLAIERSVRTGEPPDVRVGLAWLDHASARRWRSLLDEAEAAPDVRSLRDNGYVVRALQAAWWAINRVRGGSDDDVVARGVREAIRIGGDTDTVAAIAGALLGASYGVSRIPMAERGRLRGWPDGAQERTLLTLAVQATRGNDAQGWPATPRMRPYYERFGPTGVVFRFPEDDDVRFGDVAALDGVETDAVLSLCRIGAREYRGDEHRVIWLLDAEGNLDAPRVVADAADEIDRLRRAGRRVFVHCVRCERRTPAVAAAWLERHHGYDAASAWRRVREVITTASPQRLVET